MIFFLYHSASETAGLVLEEVKRLRLPFDELHLYDGEGLPRDTSDLEGLVVMGGPMNVDEVDSYPFLQDEAELISRVLIDEKPVLGICLGAQLMAKALGSRVYPNRLREVGWHPVEWTPQAASDPLLKGCRSPIVPLHWHGDTFDLPVGAVHLARSSRCENQAFRFGSHAYGLQFHLEVTPAMVNDWCSSVDGRKDLALAHESEASVRAATPEAFRHLQPWAERFFQSYLTAAYRRFIPAI